MFPASSDQFRERCHAVAAELEAADACPGPAPGAVRDLGLVNTSSDPERGLDALYEVGDAPERWCIAHGDLVGGRWQALPRSVVEMLTAGYQQAGQRAEGGDALLTVFNLALEHEVARIHGSHGALDRIYCPTDPATGEAQVIEFEASDDVWSVSQTLLRAHRCVGDGEMVGLVQDVITHHLPGAQGAQGAGSE